MESHILNSYHQARYRTIGHKIMRAKSDSLSSEGSVRHSPEYAQVAPQRAPSVAPSDDSNAGDWCQSQTINTTQSSQLTSSDDESSDGQDDVEENLVIKEDKTDDDEDVDDNLVVHELNVNDDDDDNIDVDDDTVQELHVPVSDTNSLTDTNVIEDNTLVEGHDYDVITVYEVNPDLDLIEASSDDESNQLDFAVSEKVENYDEGEYLNSEDNLKYNGTIHKPEALDTCGIDLNLDTHVVSNVDEYFIKEKDILHVDGPVVRDVDEYFIKDKGKVKEEPTAVPNVDDFFIKHKLPEEESTKFQIIPETPPNVDEFLTIENHTKNEAKKIVPEVVSENNTNVSINESDLEVLPNIEDLKRYLLEEMTYSKFKSIQRSCSVPQSPMQNICMDVDDAKTCLSFEDLNLDLSDLTFESDKDKSGNVNKSDDIPRTLTDEDVNSFLITNNKTKTKTEKDDDDLNPQDMEIEHTIQSTITDIQPVKDSFRNMMSTPLPAVIPASKVLDFCVEKTPPPSHREMEDQRANKYVLNAQATPRKFVIEPSRKAKIVPLDSKLIHNKVAPGGVKTVIPAISKPVVPVVTKHVVPVVTKTVTPVQTKPIVPVVLKSIASVTATPVTPKSVATTPVLAESKVAPADMDDFVDVESCNDTVIPVLEANNLSSLLEQFEATEKLNKNKKPLRIVPVEEQKKLNKNSLANGMRLQDAGVQLKNNKMRQILMPTTINTAIRRTPSPVHSDHDYCSSKKRHSLPNLKGGQSLLKPEVLSSNNRILSSRHRSCKNKKVVYNLSSDEESDSKIKKNTSDSELKKKTSVKPAVKPPAQSNCRKKLSPTHNVSNDEKLSPTHSVSNDVILKDKSKNTVINKCAFKASDTPCSQNSNGSIKLTIKNKSEVILNCDHKDSQKYKHNDNVEKCKVSSSISDVPNVSKDIKPEKNIKEVDRLKHKTLNSNVVAVDHAIVKEEPRPKDEKKDENFYTALFSNKQDVKIPHVVPIKKEINAFEEELNKADEIKKEEPHKKKKLNLQEYKLRRGVSSNSSSTAVSPESIFPDMPQTMNSDKTAKPTFTFLNGTMNEKSNIDEAPKKIFDPIREASRKIVANAKKQKAEALRKRDEDIVMSKIPKVDNLELQPLISDAEMMKIVGMAQPEPIPTPVVTEKPQLPADYDEIILVSVGTNTDEQILKKLQDAELKIMEKLKRKSLTPPIDPKSRINFKINKSENILKQNVFDSMKKDKRNEDKKHAETKIDKERFKDITATLKSVGKQVHTKIPSNSLFASIQDVVMKKAPEDEEHEKSEKERRHSKPRSPVEKREVFKFGRPIIVREYNEKADHGEDKIILHLGKQRVRPISANIIIQTDPVSETTEISKAKTIAKEKSSVNRRRNDSDMSMSSEGSPVSIKDKSPKRNKVVSKPKADVRPEKRSLSKEKRSRSKDRHEAKYRRRSRSLSRSRRRRRSPSRSRSRSRGRFRRYRRSDRSDSPYKRKRRTRSRSRSRSYHKRRSPSIKRDNRNRSRSKSRPKSKSPVAKKSKPSPQNDRKPIKSMTPPLRKPTVSESSDSSTSSSSSSSSGSSTSSSSSSASSDKSRSCSPYKLEAYRKKAYRSFSSEDRENNTPVEERRIVFVGKLEKDITKSTLRGQFSKFGAVVEVRLHTKEDGSRYGFVTYKRARDAWTAVEAASTFPQYDVGFGGRRAFCRQSYADLDGLEAKYTESAFHGAGAPPTRRTDDMSFEQMLLEMKKKLSQRKNEMNEPA